MRRRPPSVRSWWVTYLVMSALTSRVSSPSGFLTAFAAFTAFLAGFLAAFTAFLAGFLAAFTGLSPWSFMMAAALLRVRLGFTAAPSGGVETTSSILVSFTFSSYLVEWLRKLGAAIKPRPPPTV